MDEMYLKYGVVNVSDFMNMNNIPEYKDQFLHLPLVYLGII